MVYTGLKAIERATDEINDSFLSFIPMLKTKITSFQEDGCDTQIGLNLGQYVTVEMVYRIDDTHNLKCLPK